MQAKADPAKLGRRPFDEGQALSIIEEHAHRPGAMLPILHALQEAFGYIDASALPLIASILNVSKAEVHGVMTFYHDFRSKPAGRHVLKICRAEACQAMGVETLADYVEGPLGRKIGETDAGGNLTIETVYCLGNCALGPSAMLDGELIGRLDQDRLDQLIREAGAGVH